MRKLVLALVGGALLVTIGTVWWWWRTVPPIAEILSRLPQTDRMIAHADIATLRSAGVLYVIAGGNNNSEESDYKKFVQQTGFDYRRDLDSVSMSWRKDETFFILTGRFDWSKLQSYATSQGGSCSGGVCKLASSTPGRRISYQRLNGVTLALASSVDDTAVGRLKERSTQPFTVEIPSHPAWMLLPASLLRDEAVMPAGTRMFASAVLEAESVVLAIGGQSVGADMRYEAMLDARYKTPAEAAETAAALKIATGMLNKLLARDKQTPNPRDLSGVLARGEFRSEDTHVVGIWPIERAFLENFSR